MTIVLGFLLKNWKLAAGGSLLAALFVLTLWVKHQGAVIEREKAKVAHEQLVQVVTQNQGSLNQTIAAVPVADLNNASDGDLFMAYALSRASRRLTVPRRGARANTYSVGFIRTAARWHAAAHRTDTVPDSIDCAPSAAASRRVASVRPR